MGAIVNCVDMGITRMYFVLQPASAMATVNLPAKQVFILLPVIGAGSFSATDDSSSLQKCVPVNNSFVGIPDNHMFLRFLGLNLPSAQNRLFCPT